MSVTSASSGTGTLGDADSGRWSGSASGAFWREADPALMAAIDRHNARIGGRLERACYVLFTTWLVGPIAYLALRILFRIEVRNLPNVERAARGPFVYALRHYFEWDVLISYFGSVWLRSLVRPRLAAHPLAGHFWMKTRPRRALSFLFGIVGVSRSRGFGCSGLARGSALLAAGRTIVVCPTGPIGRKRRYDVKPGIGWLAVRNPAASVLPVTLVGLQDVQVGDVLRLRRPRIAIAFGEPFAGADVDGATEEARIEAVCERVRAGWNAEEARVA